MGDIGTFAPIHGQFSRNALTKKRTGAEWAEEDDRMRFATDLTALGGTLSLEAGVVGVTLTDAGKVEACKVLSDIEPGSA
jgi:hypothetical protein